MKKAICIGFLFLCIAGYVFSDITKDLKKADLLYDEFKYSAANTFLLNLIDKALGNKEKTEVYWRLARVILYLGDAAEDAGKPKDEILSFFVKGEEYADKAIQYDPNNHLGYYWKSSNMGRWGQVKGILNSLFKADPMKKLLVKAINIDSGHADSFYVLGELYDELPGFPISFGSINYSVSLGRKCVALHEADRAAGREPEIKYGFYIKLAKHLRKRGWSAAKRKSNIANKKKNYNKNTDILKKNFYFEGTITLKNMSDKEEAMEIINKVIADLEGLANRDKQENDDLADAIELKEGWK